MLQNRKRLVEEERKLHSEMVSCLHMHFNLLLPNARFVMQARYLDSSIGLKSNPYVSLSMLHLVES